MVGKSSQTGQQLGKLVALEGNIETISTQLRLLPPSSKILVIPSILEDLPVASEDSTFNARAFVRDVHEACGKRRELARSFLQQSTPSHPRLVFMNGGSISAQATCISTICEKATNGHIGEAETVFTDIIKDGVAGLMREVEPSQELNVQETPSRNEDYQKVQEWHEDPSTIAMKAADSLDRATAALQYSEAEEVFEEVETMPEQHIEAASRYGPSETQQVPTEIREDVFTSANGETIVRSVITLPAGEARRSFIPRIGRPKHSKHQKKPSITPSLIIYEDYTETLSTGADSLLSTISAPVTPQNVVFGEACLVDVQSASPAEKRIRRVTSVDRFDPSSSRVREPNLILQGLQQRYSTNFLDVRPSTLAGKMQKRASHSEFEALPRTTFVRAFQTTIRRTPTLASPITSASPSPPRVFVDRGTDASRIGPSSEALESADSGAFEPVFTVFEDLIIHFADDSENEIFESVMRSCKNDYSSKASQTVSESLRPRESTSLASRCPECHSIAKTDDEGHARRHEIDPYRTSLVHDNTFGSNTKPLRISKYIMESVNEPNTPPTPASTPPPSSYGLSQRFHEFPANSDTAIDIQNSLRSVLERFLPTGEYSQHYFAISPESDRLWKPVFCSDVPHTENEGRTVDQILAFGCEKGVNADFFAELSGQVEKLGAKKSGISRSGRLDLRYLIANAIQAFVAHPVNSQTAVDPLFDPTLLATLIIPHLEAYLVTNTQIRFLILHYSSTQLPIILALRDLVGSTLFKVAGILDSLSNDPPSFGKRRPQTPTKSSPLSKGSDSPVRLPRTTYQKHTKSLSSISFSKANYLLPSTATDSEITNFLSVIWKSLIETDPFYNPEPESPAISKSRRTIHNSPTTTTSTPSSSLSKITSPKTPPQTPKSYLSSRYGREHQEAPNKVQQRQSKPRVEKDVHGRRLQAGDRHHSYTSIRSARTTASARERQSERDWANFYIGEDDSEDDAYDRMVLGRAGIIPGKTVYGRKDVTGCAIPVTRGMTDGSVGRKRPINSKKALRWLGLA